MLHLELYCRLVKKNSMKYNKMPISNIHIGNTILIGTIINILIHGDSDNSIFINHPQIV